ncbi:MAG: YfiT family bacillithiol transferase, partial [Saprospiraceae bacterium]
MKEQDNRRYPIGPFEYGQAYSLDDTRKHIRALDRFPKELKKAVKKLRGSELDKVYRSGGWTARQVIHHIADSHMNAYIRMKLAVTENTPIIKPYEESLWAQTEDGAHGSVKMSIKLLSALHARWVNFLESLTEEDLERAYYNPASKRTVQMQEAIALYVWHSQHHLHHIRLVSDGKGESEPASAPDIDTRSTAGAQSLPKRSGPNSKAGKAIAAAATAPKKRGMSEEHKDKIRASHQARRAAKAGDSLPALSAKAKRPRRTQAQMAADRAATPDIGRKKPGPKPKAAAKTNSSATTARYGIKEKGIKGAKANAAGAPATAKRIRRTK